MRPRIIHNNKCEICGSSLSQYNPTRKVCPGPCTTIKSRRYTQRYRKLNPDCTKAPSKASVAETEIMFNYEVKTRECLKCGERFESQGNFNRCCNGCGLENDRTFVKTSNTIERKSSSKRCDIANSGF